MRLKILIITFLCLINFNIYSQVAPHPLKGNSVPEELMSYDFNNNILKGSHISAIKSRQNLINNILVLRIEFPDLQFNAESRFPSFHPHNEEYFDKYMQHLKNFYLDASHGKYELNYHIAPNVYVANNSFQWYGDDNFEAERRVLLVNELIQKADNDIDFNNFEAVIVFHAGAGQESDIESSQQHSLWSTFMSVNTFKHYLDPNNDNYAGIPTTDGSYITRLAFLPEWQYHPYFQENDNYHFDILGVLANQFGRILGLPTLFDNVPSNGSSAGIGNFCIMGTGMWNNNGKIPCLPSAWVRYFAGWDDPYLIKQNKENIVITYPMSKYSSSEINKMYKIQISEKEYFLIENRQQNFIKDFVEYNGQVVEFPLHSFELLPEDEQDYYPGLPYNIPIVNLMKNNLRGSEWDYFLPYMDMYGNYVDGSGLLIWHIDENIIEQNFASNTINGNALHKGVDLEEADGIQHMDSSLPHHYMRGGPFDSFRAGNNTYFGKQINPETGHFSAPDASSYYGGVYFEIYNISASDTLMTFSVRFEPWSQADFHTENYLEPFVYDFNNDGVNEVHFISSDGFLNIFEDNTLKHHLDLESDTVAFNYTFNGKDKLLIPAQDKFFTTTAKLHLWEGNISNSPFPMLDVVWEESDLIWAGPVIHIDDEWIYQGVDIKWVLALNSANNNDSKVYFMNEQFDIIKLLNFDGKIISNLIYNKSNIQYFTIPNDYSKPVLITIDNELNQNLTYFNNDSIFNNIIIKQIFSSDYLKERNEIFVWGKNENLLLSNFFTFNHNTQNIEKININFPYTLTGNPTLADVNKNGRPDLILSHSNGVKIFSLNGSLIKKHNMEVIEDNNTGSGLIAWDANNDGNYYYFGTFSGNRFRVFDNDFKELKEYSRIFAHPVRTNPFITENNGQISLYQATDKGRIYEFSLGLFMPENLNNLTWSLSNVNYFRNSYWKADLDSHYPETGNVFIDNETYVYPNPWMKRHHTNLKFNIMTSKAEKVNIKIYDISGRLIAQKSDYTEAFVVAKEIFDFNPEKWSSGIYFAIVEASGKNKTIKFSIEK